MHTGRCGKIPERFRGLIKDLHAGDKIFFDRIKAEIDEEYWSDNTINKPSDTSPRTLDPMAFTIAVE